MTAPRRPRADSSRPSRRATRPASAPCADGEHLWAYLDGELPAARARAVARHLAACPACGARARRLRTMLERCRAAGCRTLPADVRARARARVRALLGKVPKKR